MTLEEIARKHLEEAGLDSILAGMRELQEELAKHLESLKMNRPDDPLANQHDGGLVRAAREVRNWGKP
jgi:hypothetical protein